MSSPTEPVPGGNDPVGVEGNLEDGVSDPLVTRGQFRESPKSKAGFVVWPIVAVLVFLAATKLR
jgi:hypothetical protein